MTTERGPVAAPELLALAAEGEAMGFEYGTDFAVAGVPASLSSETLIFGVDGDGYTVTYTDMGRRRRLFASPHFDEARRRFLDEVSRLAGPRGRGPLAGRPAGTGYEGLTTSEIADRLRALGIVDPGGALPELVALKERGEALGLRYGMDFAIAHVPVAMSSELIVLDLVDDAFVYSYRDMGRSTEIGRGATLDEVAEPFLSEVARLAAGRGRGPLVGVPDPRLQKTPRQAFEEMQARGFFPGLAWPGDDEELSAATVAYVSRGRSPFPRLDPDAVRALATRRTPDELLAAVRGLFEEMNRIPVDWQALGYHGGCDHVVAVVAGRHPELSAAALAALGWHYSYVSR